MDLNRLLDPKSVALVGASDKPGSVGASILGLLMKSSCIVYPVNPKRETLLGMKCYPSVLGIPEAADVAVITVPAEAAVAVAEDCGKKGIPYLIVVAGGFGEAGEEGRRLQDRLKALAAEYGFRVLGPNTLGVFFPEKRFDTIFVEHGDESLAGGGGISFISQSGSVGIEALGVAGNIGFGLRAFAGLGNKCDLEEIDFLRFFGDDPGTTCIAFYLESVNRGRAFLDLAKTISRKKPIVGLKAGRTESGARAVNSHTGRLAGSDLVVSGAFYQHGIQRVLDDEELCDAARALEKLPLPKGNRVAVLSPAGGYGVICSDYIETPSNRAPLCMARLSRETEEKIAKATFSFASCRNPVDVTASASVSMYGAAASAILEDPGVDILICLVFFSPPAMDRSLVEEIARRAKDSEKPLVVFAHHGPFTEGHLLDFFRLGVVGYPSISRTVRAVRFLLERKALLEGLEACP